MDWYDSLIGFNTIPIYLEELFRRVNIFDEAHAIFTVVLFGSLSRPRYLTHAKIALPLPSLLVIFLSV
jgi:hypothetical protein